MTDISTNKVVRRDNGDATKSRTTCELGGKHSTDITPIQAKKIAASLRFQAEMVETTRSFTSPSVLDNFIASLHPCWLCQAEHPSQQLVESIANDSSTQLFCVKCRPPKNESTYIDLCYQNPLF